MIGILLHAFVNKKTRLSQNSFWINMQQLSQLKKNYKVREKNKWISKTVIKISLLIGSQKVGDSWNLTGKASSKAGFHHLAYAKSWQTWVLAFFFFFNVYILKENQG